jgi:hydrogenase/urease accessory protein HupE
MITLGILILAFLAVYVYQTNDNAAIRVSFVKGLMFGFVFGEAELEEGVTCYHYQLGFAFVILTIDWYVEV